MTVSTQQIQTVLRTYNKQLKLAGLHRANRCDLPQARKDEVTLSAEGTRQQISQQSASRIVDRITYKEITVTEGTDRKT
jgi:hypothetical protein